ncbi:MAG: putative transport system ATP-binding protein, partial [Mycobacterium sp.]|nr:putative transport system ATP-binding protein [Mycobacterium sp.]
MKLQWSATASPKRVASDDRLVQSQRERHDVSELIAAETGPQDRIGPECALHGAGDGGLRAKPVLQLKGVGKSYRRGDEQVQVLIDFDFIVEAGEFVVVTGPSGAGKTTLLHIAGGLDAP